jgi:MFS superfamily sulfate permease-like transporter
VRCLNNSPLVGNLGHFQKDTVVELIDGIVAIPLAMAFVIAKVVRLEYGLYTTIIAGIMGGSKYQIAGPTSVALE